MVWDGKWIEEKIGHLLSAVIDHTLPKRQKSNWPSRDGFQPAAKTLPTVAKVLSVGGSWSGTPRIKTGPLPYHRVPSAELIKSASLGRHCSKGTQPGKWAVGQVSKPLTLWQTPLCNVPSQTYCTWKALESNYLSANLQCSATKAFPILNIICKAPLFSTLI